jgi:hypothetical protein
MFKYVYTVVAFCVLAQPALASGKLKCAVAKADMKPRAELEAKLIGEGWKVKKSKIDGGCYEVYGTMPDGVFVEAYFDPASFEKLLVMQRGKTIFSKNP